MITKKILLLSLFIVVSCTKSHTMELQLQEAHKTMIQARMAYLQTPEYKTWTSLDHTKELMACYDTPAMSAKINTARKNAETTSEYLAFTEAHKKYFALKEESQK